MGSGSNSIISSVCLGLDRWWSFRRPTPSQKTPAKMNAIVAIAPIKPPTLIRAVFLFLTAVGVASLASSALVIMAGVRVVRAMLGNNDDRLDEGVGLEGSWLGIHDGCVDQTSLGVWDGGRNDGSLL